MATRFVTPRAALFGGLLLILSVIGLEIGLRVRDSYTRPGGDVGSRSRFVLPDDRCYVRQAAHAELRLASGVTLQTNSFGCRCDEPRLPKPAETFRITCLGDERVLGLALSSETLWTSHLKTFLGHSSSRPPEVLNAGSVGGCPLLASLWYRHTLSAWESDLVLLVASADDAFDDRRIRRCCRLDSSDVPISAAHPESSAAASGPSSDARSYSLLADAIKTRLFGHVQETNSRRTPEISGDLNATGVRQAAAPCAVLKQLVEGHFGRFVVVVLPAETEQGRLHEQTFAAELAALEIETIELRSLGGDHAQPEWHGQVAAELETELRRRIPQLSGQRLPAAAVDGVRRHR